MLITNAFAWFFTVLSVISLIGGAPIMAGFYAAFALWNRSEVLDVLTERLGEQTTKIHFVGVILFIVASFLIPAGR